MKAYTAIVLMTCLGASAAPVRTIKEIRVTGERVKVFDHTQKREELNISDGCMNAWREADGTVNLMMPCYETYRLRGPDLLHLTLSPNKIYSGGKAGFLIQEDLYNCMHWPLGPYSEDGRNFYSLAHHEWYGCLLDGGITDGRWPGWDYLGKRGALNSWVTTVTSLKTSDGGASWSLNDVDGTHVVARPGFHWSGTKALENKIYLKADNRCGLQQITRIIKEGKYYYAMGNLFYRDFAEINIAAGVYQAPMANEGVVIIRTTDFKNPNGWQVWTGGSNYAPISTTPVANWKTFYPQRAGKILASWSPTFLYDTNAQMYIFNFSGGRGREGTDGSASTRHGPVYYMTTATLANPSWNDYRTITGSQQLETDPNGPWTGFADCFYATIIDPQCKGYNFESTSSGKPWMFWNTAPSLYNRREMKLRNDIYRIQLKIEYDPPLDTF